jgi:hypothetical protein
MRNPVWNLGLAIILLIAETVVGREDQQMQTGCKGIANQQFWFNHTEF